AAPRVQSACPLGPGLPPGTEPVRADALHVVRSGRHQHGGRRALRRHRHRGLSAGPRLELRRERHLLTRETAMSRHHVIALLVLSVALIGCTDLLVEDPKGFTTTDTFFQTGADLNSATIAIYNALRGLEG